VTLLFAAALLSLSTPPLKAEITLCEAVESDGATFARPIAPTDQFRVRGAEPNVHAIAKLPPTVEAKKVKFTVLDSSNKVVASVDAPAFGGLGAAKLSVAKPGDYLMQVGAEEPNTILGETPFKVLADSEGPFANGTQPTGQGSLWICKEVNDDWLPVGSTADAKTGNRLFTWKADEGFNILIKNKPKTPFGTLFLGIIIHKQGEDGKDFGFVNEYQSEQLEENVASMWCTVQPPTSLPAGRYTLYIIDWYTREPTEHNGNLKQYFAKITIVVK
jgi:hypothetical protein